MSDSVTGSDAVLARLMRPTTSMCLRLLTEMQHGKTPDTRTLQTAVHACKFLLDLPFNMPDLALGGSDTGREPLERRANFTAVLETESVLRILAYVLARSREDRETRRAGQRDLLELSLASRELHNLCTGLLWRDPSLDAFPDVLSFALGLEIGSRATVGAQVRRLDLPMFPAWTIGGPSLLSCLVGGMARACAALRVLKLDPMGFMLDVAGLATVFDACTQLTAVRVCVTLEESGMAARQQGDSSGEWLPSPSPTPSDDSFNADGDKGSAFATETSTSADSATYAAIGRGVSRLALLDVAAIRSPSRATTSQFLAALRGGITTTLRHLFLGAFEDVDSFRTTARDLASVLTAVAARCPDLTTLHVVLADNQSVVGIDALNTALRTLPASCCRLHTIAVRHWPQRFSTVSAPHAPADPSNDPPASYIPRLRPALHDLACGAAPALAQLDLQGLRPTAQLLDAITRLAPATLRALLLDIDACPPPRLVHLVEHRGAALRSLSLLSAASPPTYQVLAAVARHCGSLIRLDLRRRMPDPTEGERRAQFANAGEWIEALKTVLRRCTALTRVDVSWLPEVPYWDPVWELDSEFPGVIAWGAFPPCARELMQLEYPIW